jgi:hypothetical protein
VLLKIPNKLLITPYHVSEREFGPNSNFKDVWSIAPELFDPKYPYKGNKQIKSKIENEYADYF